MWARSSIEAVRNQACMLLRGQAGSKLAKVKDKVANTGSWEMFLPVEFLMDGK
jgi:hypothetical protein